MGTDTVHISNLTTCQNMGTINVDDEWWITAYYNSTEHSPMFNTNVSLAPIMGISIIYVAPMNLTSTTANSPGNIPGSKGGPSTSGVGHEFATNLAKVLSLGVLAAVVSAIM